MPQSPAASPGRSVARAPQQCGSLSELPVPVRNGPTLETHVVPPLGFLFRELWRDKSVQRAGMNWVLRQWQNEIRGTVLDLGCGRDPSGIRGMAVRNGASYIGADYSIGCQPKVVLDLNQPLPFADQSADTVVIANCMYIITRPEDLLREAQRVLRPAGTVIVIAPLVWQYYPEPKDMWRFTNQGVEFLLRSAGFDEVCIVAIGGRWSAAVHLISPFLQPGRIVRPVAHLVAVALDEVLPRLVPRFPRAGDTPLVYCAKARRLEERTP
jgi:SAM-dependent methyltransferase